MSASTPYFAAIACTPSGSRGRNQNPRRRFVEQQEFRPQIAIEIDLRADLVGRTSIRPAPPPSPPSLKSCADSAKPSSTISRIAACTRFSYSISSAGGSPHKRLDDVLGVLGAAETHVVARPRVRRAA